MLLEKFWKFCPSTDPSLRCFTSVSTWSTGTNVPCWFESNQSMKLEGPCTARRVLTNLYVSGTSSPSYAVEQPPIQLSPCDLLYRRTGTPCKKQLVTTHLNWRTGFTYSGCVSTSPFADQGHNMLANCPVLQGMEECFPFFTQAHQHMRYV